MFALLRQLESLSSGPNDLPSGSGGEFGGSAIMVAVL
jgi:hypothetical protein